MRTEELLLDLGSYQQALLAQGAPFPADTDYLVPSIVGHVGTLFTLKSAGSRITPGMRSTVYGDVAARTAILQLGLGVTRLQPAYPANGPRDARDPMLRLLSAATGVYRSHIQATPAGAPDEWLIDAAEALWRTLRGCSDAVAGVTFQTVLRSSLKTAAQL